MFIDLLTAFTPLIVSVLVFLVARKRVIKYLFTSIMKVLITDEYHENLFEMIPAARRLGFITIMENQLRSERGRLLYRSMGSSKKWPNLETISFTPAQTTPFPLDKDTTVDLTRKIGPKAKKPMEIDIPIMIGAMAYGLSLTKEAMLAMTFASAEMKTAMNSGEGGVLPESREAAHKFILQFSKTAWGKEEELISNVDMIEVKLGQGALAGMGEHIGAERIPSEAKELMGLKSGEGAMIHEHFFEDQTLRDVSDLVKALRDTSKGVPIGVKIMASQLIEEDIDRMLDIGVDVITIEGGQGGTHGAPPIMQDDFGIPTLHAVVRADKYLRKKKQRKNISLIAAGGLNVPGDFLKILALGADALYIGSAMLYAINHTQLLKPLPWEPPSQTIWSTGSKKDEFDVNEGAQSGTNFLKACTEEMRIALRAMGKSSLDDLSLSDLVTYDETIAKMAGIPYSFASPKKAEK